MNGLIMNCLQPLIQPPLLPPGLLPCPSSSPTVAKRSASLYPSSCPLAETVLSVLSFLGRWPQDWNVAHITIPQLPLVCTRFASTLGGKVASVRYAGSGVHGCVYDVGTMDGMRLAIKVSLWADCEAQCLAYITKRNEKCVTYNNKQGRGADNRTFSPALVTNGHYWVATEFVAGKTLLALVDGINASNRIDFGCLVSIQLELAKAVHHLHKMGVLHGDLKPSNVIMQRHDDCNTLRAVLCDFAHCAPFTTAARRSLRLCRDAEHWLAQAVPYRPPELLLRGRPLPGDAQSSEVWAVGCIMLEISVGLVLPSDELRALQWIFSHVGDQGRSYRTLRSLGLPPTLLPGGACQCLHFRRDGWQHLCLPEQGRDVVSVDNVRNALYNRVRCQHLERLDTVPSVASALHLCISACLRLDPCHRLRLRHLIATLEAAVQTVIP